MEDQWDGTLTVSQATLEEHGCEAVSKLTELQDNEIRLVGMGNGENPTRICCSCGLKRLNTKHNLDTPKKLNTGSPNHMICYCDNSRAIAAPLRACESLRKGQDFVNGKSADSTLVKRRNEQK